MAGATFPFMDLPTELQMMILCRASLETLCACAQTCSQLHLLCQEEEVWANLARRQYGAALPPTSADFSPRQFYREMLHSHRRHLGLWQRDERPYGGLLRVSVRGVAIVFEEILAPQDTIFGALRSNLQLTLTQRKKMGNGVSTAGAAAVRIQCHMPRHECKKIEVKKVKFQKKPKKLTLKVTLNRPPTNNNNHHHFLHHLHHIHFHEAHDDEDHHQDQEDDDDEDHHANFWQPAVHMQQVRA